MQQAVHKEGISDEKSILSGCCSCNDAGRRRSDERRECTGEKRAAAPAAHGRQGHRQSARSRVCLDARLLSVARSAKRTFWKIRLDLRPMGGPAPSRCRLGGSEMAAEPGRIHFRCRPVALNGRLVRDV